MSYKENLDDYRNEFHAKVGSLTFKEISDLRQAREDFFENDIYYKKRKGSSWKEDKSNLLKLGFIQIDSQAGFYKITGLGMLALQHLMIPRTSRADCVFVVYKTDTDEKFLEVRSYSDTELIPKTGETLKIVSGPNSGEYFIDRVVYRFRGIDDSGESAFYNGVCVYVTETED